jgi:hypothetical protein
MEEEEDIRVKLVRAGLVRVPVLRQRTTVMAMPTATATATATAMAADPGLLGDLLDGGDRCCGSIAGV